MLLHQVLVSDLVVPIMLAEAPEHRSLTHFGVRPAENTWLRPDLVVALRERLRSDLPYVTGVPLLVVGRHGAHKRDLDIRRGRFGQSVENGWFECEVDHLSPDTQGPEGSDHRRQL